MSRYPKLPAALGQMLREIEPSRDQLMSYYPCVVVLRSGTVFDCVYIQNEIPYLDMWGI